MKFCAHTIHTLCHTNKVTTHDCWDHRQELLSAFPAASNLGDLWSPRCRKHGSNPTLVVEEGATV